MGTKRFDVLFDCARFGADVRVQCPQCGHQAFFNASDLMKRMRKLKRPPLNQMFHSVGEKMRCSQCGAKPVKVGPGMGYKGPR